MAGKCPCCGALIEGDKCDYCGYIVPNPNNISGQPIIINNNITQTVEPERKSEFKRPPSDRSKTAALILCILLGWLGVHQFYAGKKGMGVLYIFTVGLCCIGWWVDIFLIATGKFKDSMGCYITN